MSKTLLIVEHAICDQINELFHLNKIQILPKYEVKIKFNTFRVQILPAYVGVQRKG